MPDEVIVVDNNSTDNTVAIAEEYPFVQVVREKHQGLIPARNTGFQASTSTILGRLDADSVLNAEWVKSVKLIFSHNNVDAVTGPAATFIDIHLPWLMTTLWSRMYFLHAKSVFRFQILWGPNMAVRRDAWEEVKSELCIEDRIVHEDQDLSVILKAHGKKIIYDDRLVMTTDGSRQGYLPKALEYQRRKKRTLALHRRKGTLQKAQQGGIRASHAYFIRIGQLPLAVAFGVLSVIYTIEVKLGLRRQD